MDRSRAIRVEARDLSVIVSAGEHAHFVTVKRAEPSFEDGLMVDSGWRWERAT